MSINRYIVASSLFHLLLIGLLTIINPLQKVNPPIFNVRLIEPPEIASSEPLKGVENQRKIFIPIKKRGLDEFLRAPDKLLGDDTKDTNSKRHEKDTESSHLSNEEPKTPSVNGSDGTGSGKNGQGEITQERTKPEPSKFLFDKETIEKFARAQPPDSRSLTFDAPEFKHRGYMRMLKQRIESIWVYPHDAIRQGISGELYIKFSINKDGSLGEVELIRTSGHRSLDEAAMKAIRDAQPFWPLPDDWQGNELVINGHFIYILGETVVM